MLAGGEPSAELAKRGRPACCKNLLSNSAALPNKTAIGADYVGGGEEEVWK